MIRRTKIVATLGPSTDGGDTLRQLIAKGVNTARLNFSHDDPENHRRRTEQARAEAAREGRHVAILGDLQGPKIRVGKFTDGSVYLDNGSEFVLGPAWPKDCGTNAGVSVDYQWRVKPRTASAGRMSTRADTAD